MSTSQEDPHRHQQLRGHVPAGVTLENCRKAGLDMVRLWINQPREQRVSGVLLGALGAVVGLVLVGKGDVGAQAILAVSLLVTVIAITAPEPRLLLSLTGDRLNIIGYRRWWWPVVKDQQRIPYGDIESISIRYAGQSQTPSLEIKAQNVVRRVGAGLPIRSISGCLPAHYRHRR